MATENAAHASAEVGVRGLHESMIVRVKETPCMHKPATLARDVTESSQIRNAISIVQHNRVSTDALRDDVMDRSDPFRAPARHPAMVTVFYADDKVALSDMPPLGGRCACASRHSRLLAALEDRERGRDFAVRKRAPLSAD